MFNANCKRPIQLLLIGLCFTLLVACAQSPTRNQQIVDNRPMLSFELADSISSRQAQTMDIYINELLVGRLGDYLAGETFLRVLPGSHQIRVQQGNTIIWQEALYLADGSRRVVRVP